MVSAEVVVPAAFLGPSLGPLNHILRVCALRIVASMHMSFSSSVSWNAACANDRNIPTPLLSIAIGLDVAIESPQS